MSARFVKVPEALLRHAAALGLDDGLYRLLTALLAFDWDNGRPVRPEQSTLAEWCDVNVKTVQRRSERLVSLGLIERSRPQRRGPWHYDLTPLHRRLAELDFEATPNVASRSPLEATPNVASKPLSKRHSKRQLGAFEATPGASRSDTALSPDVDAVKTQTHSDVDNSHTPRAAARSANGDVCEDEIADQVLAHFNERAHATYTERHWGEMIAERVAEHPELTVENHREIIDRNFARPWWRGDPSPLVLFKNAVGFEKAINRHGQAPQYESKSERKERRWQRYQASTRAAEWVVEGTVEEEVTEPEVVEAEVEVTAPDPDPSPEREHEPDPEPVESAEDIAAKELGADFATFKAEHPRMNVTRAWDHFAAERKGQR